MDLNHFRPAIPEIERRLRNLRPDALVVGLGPSARLLPLLDPSLLAGVRTFGVNDVFRFFPTNDLVVMDSPARCSLKKGTDRHTWIVDSRPERLWIYEPSWGLIHDRGRSLEGWSFHIAPEMRERVRLFKLNLLNLRSNAGVKPDLDAEPIHHVHATPCGTTVIAWKEGCRRIGVIGVDVTPNHSLFPHLHVLTWFFKYLARDARAKGGEIVNLSPISNVKKFDPVEEKATTT